MAPPRPLPGLLLPEALRGNLPQTRHAGQEGDYAVLAGQKTRSPKKGDGIPKRPRGATAGHKDRRGLKV